MAFKLLCHLNTSHWLTGASVTHVNHEVRLHSCYLSDLFGFFILIHLTNNEIIAFLVTQVNLWLVGLIVLEQEGSVPLRLDNNNKLLSRVLLHPNKYEYFPHVLCVDTTTQSTWGKILVFIRMEQNSGKQLVVVVKSKWYGPFLLENNEPYKPEVYLRDKERYDLVIREMDKDKEAEQVAEVAAMKPYFVINMCDGSPGEPMAGIEVAEELERHGLVFTGCSSASLKVTKQQMKDICVTAGIPTPRFRFAFSADDIKLAAKELNFPLFAKHHNGYNSVSMSKDAKALNEEELLRVSGSIMEEFGGVLIEEYIAPREFTVLLVESLVDGEDPIVLTPVECIFTDGEEFKHFDLKWKDSANIGWKPVTDEKEIKLLETTSIQAFKAMNFNSFIRIDYRMNAKGELYFLEANANCSIFFEKKEAWGSADFILSLDPRFNQVSFLDHLIQLAFKEHKKSSAAKESA
eukprot:TRINITY_DN17327_c0_g1_i1.p1 TRINITY_DN17327_c0_g1~~TRINITY_DN17327_c0_g1_i1.p1  ORF type:complete len:462 (+),score=104.55 TRINITY_DN17327_c0_g1_i1:859-2244(+)